MITTSDIFINIYMYWHTLPNEKIISDTVIGKDLEICDEWFFKKNPQIRCAQLEFSELIDNVSKLIPYLSSIEELLLEGFSSTYTISVDLTGLKSVKTLTLINCIVDGDSLLKLQSLEVLNICNCNVSEKDKSINDFIYKLPLIELHDLSDDPRYVSDDIITDNINPKYINYHRLKKLTIQYSMHNKLFKYPPIKSLTIVNTDGCNVILCVDTSTEVILR